ncbi:MAG TPA: TolC family protein [Kofleriaceae bacterium]|nr:TolC family protein [Kofleriaceae bacterium]
MHCHLVSILASALGALGLAGALAGPARGDADPPYAPPPFLAEPPALPPTAGDQVLRLDLAGAIALAMRQNLGIVVKRSSARSTRLTVAQTIWSAYEPVLNLTYGRSGADQPPATLQAGQPGSLINTSSDTATASIAQHLPTGGSLGASVSAGRTLSSSGTAVEPLNYSTSATVSLSQPLLRGFSTDLAIPQMSILTAKIESEKARYDFEASAATLIQQTEAAYWSVVSRLYAYGIAARSQQLAEDTTELVRRQVAAGMTSSAQLPGAEATLAQRKLAVLTAEAAVDAAWDQLRAILNLPRDQWALPILPTERPRFDAGELPTAEVALDTAIHHRPEIASMHLDMKKLALDIRQAQNTALPDLGIDVSTSSYGQAPTLGGAIRQLTGHGSTGWSSGWSAGLHLSWAPLGQANKVNAEMQRIRNEVQIVNQDQLVQTIWSDVRRALRDQRAAALQVILASKSRTLTSQSLEIENRKYASGTSSNIAIATVQNALAEAEVAEIEALLNHAAAQTALLLATGQLLDQRHVKIEIAEER